MRADCSLSRYALVSGLVSPLSRFAMVEKDKPVDLAISRHVSPFIRFSAIIVSVCVSIFHRFRSSLVGNPERFFCLGLGANRRFMGFYLIKGIIALAGFSSSYHFGTCPAISRGLDTCTGRFHILKSHLKTNVNNKMLPFLLENLILFECYLSTLS